MKERFGKYLDTMPWKAEDDSILKSDQVLEQIWSN